VRVVTWTNYAYQLGPTTLGKTVWVTLVPEVRERCTSLATEPAGLTLRLQQLLGLPPTAHYGQFVEMTVARQDVFRPCPNPDPTSLHCDELFPPEVPAEHVVFLATQIVHSYRLPDGYPFTRLGYTYDWSPHATPTHYGASEFVLKKGTAAHVTSLTPTRDYCRPPPSGQP
jgi:hypothetical protein